MLSRRGFLVGAVAFGNVPARIATAADETPPYWRAWQDALLAMQLRVTQLDWTLRPLHVQPPAEPGRLAAVEARYGMAAPLQLREVLARCGAVVTFGWATPPLLQPFDGMDLPVTGGLKDVLWSLDQLEGPALDAFGTMRKGLAEAGDGEQPNPPDLWEHQFPWMVLDGGDVLTLDVSRPEGPHPVRYFNGDLEGLHGHAIASDFRSFVSSYVALGCAGGGMDDWYRFIPPRPDGSTLIDGDGEGARRWRAWLARDPDHPGPDAPPRAVPAWTRSDFDLLEAARAGSAWGVAADLASGAVPDCVDPRQHRPDGHYGVTFETALVFALRLDDTALAGRLLEAGATLDTRRVALTEAIGNASADTVRWVLARRGRVNGWTGDRLWPIHALLVAHGDGAKLGDADRIVLLKSLLDAGADPNARWDGERTVLMAVGAEAAAILLDHGADPRLFDRNGDTALHLADEPAKVSLLVRHGADVDALTRPTPVPGGSSVSPRTPLQARLLAADEATVEALLNAGADPLRRDGSGRDALWYCRTAKDADRCIARGCNPFARDEEGATLLQHVVGGLGREFAGNEAARALFEDLLRRGIDINAARNDGTTLLHDAASIGDKNGVLLLLQHGADRGRRDRQGRLPADRVPQANAELRSLLRP